MKALTQILLMSPLALLACRSGHQPSSITWDESDSNQGQLSGDLARPTPITMSLGDNLIVGTSIPGAVEECIELPDGSKAPYYPEHETYIDVFTFTLPADQRLTKIIAVKLDVEPFHPSCGMPLDEQLGAFTALAKSDQVDWNSDSFENFVRLPSEHPLIGAGFANIEGENLISRYEGGLVFGPIEVKAMTDELSDGTYTFWWKEGANKVSYVLNFVIEEI
jgi:hypothetical protein